VSKRKYRQGRVLSLVDAVALINAGQFIYYRHKVYHHGWTQSWTLRTLIEAARKGWLKEAIKL